MIKKIPYGKQWIDQQDIHSVISVLKSDFITQGPKIEELETALSSYLGSQYCVVFNNGTSALLAACFAAGIGEGDEVITTPYTFAASANCFVWFGARPVFVDIEPVSFNIDSSKIEKAITKKTKAIITVDFAGIPCDYNEILKIAKKHKLVVIDDAAHAVGSVYKGKKIGSITDMTCFSFHPVKTITTGEGGAVTCDSKIFYNRLKLFRNHGITRDPNHFAGKNEGGWYYEMQDLGLNLRLTDIQAALGLSQLKKIEGFIKKRSAIVNLYNKAFSHLSLTLPAEFDYSRSSWHLYPVRLKLSLLKASRRDIFDELQRKDIGVQVHYIPLHLHPYFRKRFGFKKGEFPFAEKAYAEEISLPLFAKMTDTEINFVIKTFSRIIEKYTTEKLTTFGEIDEAFLQIKKGADPPTSPDIDAIVVLSGESGGSTEGIYAHDTEERVNFGIILFKKIKRLGGSPTLVLNGTDHQNKLMRKLARKTNIDKILLVQNPPYPLASTDTQMQGLVRLKFKKIAIVTHAWHGVRTKLTASKRLPKDISFRLFLLKRNAIDKTEIESEIGKIQKYFKGSL